MMEGSNKVKELVQRFETWEKNERQKLKKQGSSMEQEVNAVPATPRGQVRRLRDQLEAKSRLNQTSTVIPARKNSSLKRLQTSYYETSNEPVTSQSPNNDYTPIPQIPEGDGENQEPYVHVDAYWDEATQGYWYQNEEGQWLVFDEINQTFVDPSDAVNLINVPHQVAMNVNTKMPSPKTPTSLNSSPSRSSMFGGLERKKTERFVVETNQSIELSPSKQQSVESSSGNTQGPNSNIEKSREHEDQTKEQDDGDRISTSGLSMLNSALTEISAKVNVPVQILRKFHLGVQLYALVKSNGGMLKPIIIHLAVNRGKIYIVRQGRSRFLTIRHFSECDSTSSCIDFMARDTGKASSGMKQTIEGLRQQPLVVLWTSNHFMNKNPETPSVKKPDGDGGSKGMAFVFDNRNLRSEFLIVLKSMVDYWLTPNGIPFTFKDREEEIPVG